MFPPIRRSVFALAAISLSLPLYAEPAARPLVKHWAVADFDAVLFVALEGYRDFENGRRTYTEASCAKCHRFAGQGPGKSIVPEIAKVAERLSPRDLLEAILSPSLVVADSDVVRVLELRDGRKIEGRVVEVTGSGLRVNPDPRHPESIVAIDRSEIRSERRSAISAMPAGLLDRFEEEDILDLLAYLLSGGDEKDAMFAK